MADFTTVMTGTAQLDESNIQEFESSFLLALSEQGVMDQFASYRRDLGAKSISIPKYEQLGLATSVLLEREDVTSEAMSDSEIVLTPVEHGNVVTTTKLSNLQSGGKTDVAAARIVGINAGRSVNRLAMLACDAGTNIIFPGAVASEAALVAGNIMDASLMGKAYNKLSRSNVQGLPQAAGEYVVIMHDDVIHDIREGNAAGTWQDVHKYARPEEILRNEVGMYKGFRVIRDNLSTINVDGGAAAVDSYYSYFMGFNAFGKAVSQDVKATITGPFDKLGRFMNIGWHGVFKYKIIEPQALWIAKSASSVGVNV